MKDETGDLRFGDRIPSEVIEQVADMFLACLPGDMDIGDLMASGELKRRWDAEVERRNKAEAGT